MIGLRFIVRFVGFSFYLGIREFRSKLDMVFFYYRVDKKGK